MFYSTEYLYASIAYIYVMWRTHNYYRKTFTTRIWSNSRVS